MVTKREEGNYLRALKPVELSQLQRATHRLVPQSGPASTRAGELLRHAMFVSSTPVYKLRGQRFTLPVQEARYVLIAASDLAAVAAEIGINNWPLLIFYIMNNPNRHEDVRWLLLAVLRFVELNTCVDESVLSS